MQGNEEYVMYRRRTAQLTSVVLSVRSGILAACCSGGGKARRKRPMLLFLIACSSLVAGFACAELPAKAIQDNSFFIEEAYNQEPDVVQHILSVPAFFSSGVGGLSVNFTQEWPLFGQRHQFSYSVLHGGTKEGAAFGDTRLHYRLQALTEEGCVPAFAPRFTLIIPTGDAAKGFGHGRPGYEVNLPLSKVVSDRITLHWNAGGSFFPAVNGRDLWSGNLGGSVIYAVTENFNLMLESVAAWEQDIDRHGKVGQSVDALLSPGARWALNFPNALQIVVGIGAPMALTPASPDWGIFFYLSFEHPFVRCTPSRL